MFTNPAPFALGAALVLARAAHAFVPTSNSITAARTNPHPNTSPLTLRLSSTQPDDDKLSSTSNTVKSLLGGDYAGHSATFSSSDGKLIPVPEHLVPESLIEWGQIPSCLEVLSSEDVAIATAGDEIGLQLQRGTVSVLPEVGCGVDNLDTMRTKETFQLSSISGSTASASDGISTGQFYAFAENEDEDHGDCRQVLAWRTEMAPLRDASRIKLETAFSLPSEMTPPIDEDDGDKKSFERRIRVSFEAMPSERKISSPISVISERRIRDTSSNAQWGVGGGLDGRTVSKLIGKESVTKPFADNKPLLVGSDEGDESRGGEVTLSLPGNIVLRYDTSDNGSWYVDLILVSTAVDEEGAGGKMMISGTTTVRWTLNSNESTSPTVDCYFQ